jgi:hypothetical protein
LGFGQDSLDKPEGASAIVPVPEVPSSYLRRVPPV